MRQEQRNSPDTICSHCGRDAIWHFVDTDERLVEILCPECGRFEMSIEEFEEVEFDIAQADERRD